MRLLITSFASFSMPSIIYQRMSPSLDWGQRHNLLFCEPILARLTTDHAKQIACKPGLPTEVEEGRKHTSVAIRHESKVVAVFFISRGSKATPADYLKNQLYLTTRQTLDLARCHLDPA